MSAFSSIISLPYEIHYKDVLEMVIRVIIS